MGIVRSYINSQPLEMQGELCAIMVRDLIAEISAERGCVAANDNVFDGDITLEGKTLRAAMEILVDKDDLMDGMALFKNLMLKLELFSRTEGVSYSS